MNGAAAGTSGQYQLQQVKSNDDANNLQGIQNDALLSAAKKSHQIVSSNVWASMEKQNFSN